MATKIRFPDKFGGFWLKDMTRDSSVGRAEDCSCLYLISLGHRFKSGSRDLFAVTLAPYKTLHDLLCEAYYFVDTWFVFWKHAFDMIRTESATITLTHSKSVTK